MFKPDDIVRVRLPYSDTFQMAAGVEFGVVKLVREHQLVIDYVNKVTGQSQLVISPPERAERYVPNQFQPGFYRLKNDTRAKFIYYVTRAEDGQLRYSYSYNTEDGELLDFSKTSTGTLKISEGLITGLIRMEFQDV